MAHSNAYQQKIEWLFSRFPSYQHLGAQAYKPGLERVFSLLDLFQIKPAQIPSIHIAGTNGKGSTAAYCASLLQEKKCTVGLFTSPHIFDFSERIRVNGIPISEDFVIAFCEQYEGLNANIDASFFELTFAMALLYFQAKNCDFIVIETGLGGRLDATNVLLPKVSVITNIGFDHQEFLGDTLELIATEKAGIIKKNTPVIIGERQIATQKVFTETAQNQHAPLYFAEEQENVCQDLPLEGYQIKNFKTALLALEKIGFYYTSSQQLNAIKKLKEHTGFFGRLEILQQQPTIILDVSHNTAGITATLPLIQQQCKGQLYILYGAAKDKDAQQILSFFPSNAHISACLFTNPRSKTAADWRNLGIDSIFDNIETAIKQLKMKMTNTDLLWITGSFFLISDLKNQAKQF